MKRFLKITGISFLVLIVVYFILCLAAPPLQAEKSIVINAKDSVIFSKVADFKQWESWSPFAAKDPGINKNSVYTGTPYTKGHQCEWKSESQGSGRQVIEEVKPYSYIKTALYFRKEDTTPGYSEFKITPEGTGCKVIWNMKGSVPFMFRGMGLLMGMNKMLGKMFDDGLMSLKKDCEK